MAVAEKISTEFFCLQWCMAWLAMNEEFTSTPEETARLEKALVRTADLVFAELQKRLNIPPGDPFTVAKAFGEFVTETGYVKARFYKVSDNEIIYGQPDQVLRPVLQAMRSRGQEMKVIPALSHLLFFAAFKKLCNMKTEKVPESEQPQVNLPEGFGPRPEFWRLSPLS